MSKPILAVCSETDLLKFRKLILNMDSFKDEIDELSKILDKMESDKEISNVKILKFDTKKD